MVKNFPLVHNFPVKRAIIFDLDNCLSAANEVGTHLFEPVFDAIRRANRNCDTLSDAAIERAFSDCWRHPLDWVAKTHGFTDEMLAAGWNESVGLQVETAMRGYSDLYILKELSGLLFLVTSGFRRLQESKIRALGLERFFAKVYVDAIDEPDRKGKQKIFERILETYQLKPEDALVVGDNPDSEIEAGNRLGIRTVQILRPGVPRGNNALHYIQGLSELKDLVG